MPHLHHHITTHLYKGLPLLFLLSMLNLLYMHYYALQHHKMEDVMLMYTMVYNFFSILFDAAVIQLVWLMITLGRPKLSLLLTFLTTWMWSFANIFYMRFFNQYLTLSAMSQTGNLTDQAVISSMMAGFQWADLYYPLALLVFVMAYRHIARGAKLSRPMLATFALVPLLTFPAAALSYGAYHLLKSETRGNNELQEKRLASFVIPGSRNAFPNKTRFEEGSIRLLGWEVYDIFHKLELTQQQCESIAAEAADLSQRTTAHTPNPAIHNVVVIVLESFLSSPIDLVVNGKEITPFLNALKRETDVYYNGHLTPNITQGESGDGQFILLNGLLPLRDRLTVGEAKALTLPSLPKLLKSLSDSMYSEIVMPSPPMVWEQTHMNKVYGIDHMYCNTNLLGESVVYLNDEQLFTMAMHTPATRRQPFFSLVLSYSTHQPYRTPVDNSLTLDDDTLTDSYINYLIACHYTDMWLHRYLDYLKEQGAYENSLIVITADHHAHLDALGMNDKVSWELPLFIINGNIDNATAWHGSCNQLDVYTTILDVMGIESPWHGLGHTLLQSDYHNSVTPQAWELSEWIVKGAYFDRPKTKN